MAKLSKALEGAILSEINIALGIDSAEIGDVDENGNLTINLNCEADDLEHLIAEEEEIDVSDDVDDAEAPEADNDKG